MCWSPWNEDHIFAATSDGRVIVCAIETHSNDVLQPQHASSVLALASLLLPPPTAPSSTPLRAIASCAAGDIKCWVSSPSAESQSQKQRGSGSWRQLQLLPADAVSLSACSNCCCICSGSISGVEGSVVLASDSGWIYSASIDSLGSTRVLCSHRSHTQAVVCLDIDASGHVASGSKDGSVAVAQGLFSGDDTKISCCKGSCSGAVVAIKFCRADSSLLASCSLETSVSVWGVSAVGGSISLLPLKMFTACVGRLTCLEWVSESTDALLVGGEHQVVTEVTWRLQPDACIKSSSNTSNSGAGVVCANTSKSKRQRRDDSLSLDSTSNAPHIIEHDTEDGLNADAAASTAISAAAGTSSDGLTSKQPASAPARAVDQVKAIPAAVKSEASRRKAVDKSVLSRGAATSVISRPIPDAVQSLLRMRSVASGGGASHAKDMHSSLSLAEILCDSESRAAWAGECALAAAKNPSSADAAVAVSSLAGMHLRLSFCIRFYYKLFFEIFCKLSNPATHSAHMNDRSFADKNHFRRVAVVSAEVCCSRQYAAACSCSRPRCQPRGFSLALAVGSMCVCLHSHVFRCGAARACSSAGSLRRPAMYQRQRLCWQLSVKLSKQCCCCCSTAPAEKHVCLRSTLLPYRLKRDAMLGWPWPLCCRQTASMQPQPKLLHALATQVPPSSACSASELSNRLFWREIWFSRQSQFSHTRQLLCLQQPFSSGRYLSQRLRALS